jgi:hypothetical protein
MVEAKITMVRLSFWPEGRMGGACPVEGHARRLFFATSLRPNSSL